MFSFQYKELQATKLCLSRDGMLGMLSSRRHLVLLDLEEPEEILRKVGRTSRWEVGGAQWNPHSQLASHVSVCSNDKVEVWLWGAGGEAALVASVKASTRQVADIEWSTTQPSLLASAGMDGATQVWDIRSDLRSPAHSFKTIVATSHVRWSPDDGHLLATSHEGDIKLWDTRREAAPLSSVNVHMSRVHSIDWSRDNPTTFVTASNDCSVRYHNTVGGCQVETSGTCLTTSVPVWTAKFTPFGDGLVTSLVPHFGVHDHSLFLWTNTDLSSPVHTFSHHRDVILDFDWRRSGGDYQMVTWARDQTLRTWSLQQDILLRCGVEEDDLQSMDNSEDETSDDVLDQATEAVEEITFHKKSETPRSDDHDNVKPFVGLEKVDSRIFKITESPVKEHSPECSLENTLQREFVLLETNFNHIQIVERDLDRRTCRAVTVWGQARLLLSITFPVSYPVNTPPVFTFQSGSSLGLTQQSRSKVLKLLQETASQQVRRHRACLERCLRQLDMYLEQINQEKIAEEEVNKNSFPFVRPPDPYQNTVSFGAFQDTTVPYPRTSGSRFCSNGLLVCFGRPTFQIQVSNDLTDSSLTPRAYSSYLSSVGIAGAGSEQDLLKFGQISSANRFANLQSIHSVTSLTMTGNNLYEAPPKDQKDTIKKGRFKVKRVGSGAQEELSFLKMRRKHQRLKHSQSPVLKVTVYDISSVLPVSKELAQVYRVDSRDPVAMCHHNRDAALRLGRPEVGQVWEVAGQVVQAATLLDTWSLTPLGRPLISSLLEHQAQCRDFQTVAMLVCALTAPTRPRRKRPEQRPEQRPEREKFWFLSGGAGDSPYHTISGLSHTRLDTLLSQRNTRSNSWTEAGQEDQEDSPGGEEEGHGEARHGLLDLASSHLYSAALTAYCELLHSWGLLTQRTEVAQHGPLGDVAGCQVGRSKGGLTCLVCRLPVAGLSLVCPVCGHGGHLAHMQQWYSDHNKCPARCSCPCKRYL